MKNNVRLYFRVNSDFYEEIKRSAKNQGVSVAQFCRLKLKSSDKLDKIEFILGKLLRLKENANQ